MTTPSATTIRCFQPPHFIRELRLRPTKVLAQAMKRGPIVLARLGFKRLYIVSDPELAYHVLRYEQCFPRPWSPVEQAITALMGARVVTGFNGPAHHKRRRALAPGFTETRVRRYAPAMVKLTEEMCASWREKQVVDLCSELTRLTLRIAFEVFLSTSLREEDLDINGVASAYAEYLADRATRLMWIPLWLPTPMNRRARAARHAITQLVHHIVDQRISSGAKMDDVLDQALAGLQEGVFENQHQVVAELVNLLTSYLPTTASILSTLVELLTEQGQQTYQRLLQEAEHLVLDHPYTEQDDRKFIRFRAACQASQLERPFVPALLRRARGPQTLPGDIHIPSGSLVMIAIHAIHHQADLFPNPDTFCPERFVGQAPVSPPLGGYYTFGAGVHTCLGNHYWNLLGQLVLATLCRLVRLEVAPDQPLITREKLESVLQRYPLRVVVKKREPSSEFPPPHQHLPCIQQLLEEQAARTPDAIAVVSEETRLTYRELNTRANQLAHYLRSLGVGPESLVALCLERTADLVVGVLGVMKAGGTYVPLDPTYPVDRLAFMLEDSQPAVLVTQQHLRGNLPTDTLKVVCLDSDHAHLVQQCSDNPAPTSTPDNLAFVIYTSGSTGKPKGVEVLQRGLVNLLLSMRDQPGLTDKDRWLSVSTLSFDIASLEILLPLLVGAQVMLVSRETAKSGTALAEVLTRSKATVMQATPVTWRLLLAAGWQGNSSLKVLCGGEPLPPDLATQLLERCGSLWNLYGPTETTIYSTGGQVLTADRGITIGRPIANTQVYVLDAQLQPVPVGTPGELYIGGDGLARGYLHRPELTTERFISDPFSDKPGARIYRTGDLARFLESGELEHLGRLDQQIKVRGFRIEPGEIEVALRQHHAVRNAVVVIREDQPGEPYLAAYLVPITLASLSASSLRKTLMAQLPEYMVPAVFFILDALPVTPNGKVDRKALTAPEARQRLRDATFVAPRTQTEERLAALWAERLGLERVGRDENFFELGGQSLQATRILTWINAVFQVHLPPSTLFERPTISALAAEIEQRLAPSAEPIRAPSNAC